MEIEILFLALEKKEEPVHYNLDYSYWLSVDYLVYSLDCGLFSKLENILISISKASMAS